MRRHAFERLFCDVHSKVLASESSSHPSHNTTTTILLTQSSIITHRNNALCVVAAVVGCCFTDAVPADDDEDDRGRSDDGPRDGWQLVRWSCTGQSSDADKRRQQNSADHHGDNDHDDCGSNPQHSKITRQSRRSHKTENDQSLTTSNTTQHNHSTKMKYIAALSLATAVSAFAPLNTEIRTSSALRNDMWDNKDGGDKGEMSQALPFVPRPKILDGTLAGDVGFE